MVQFQQRTLAGPELEERKEASRAAGHLFSKIVKEEPVELESADMKRFLTLQFADVAKERRRIGGDWVVAGALINKQTRSTLSQTTYQTTSHTISSWISLAETNWGVI